MLGIHSDACTQCDAGGVSLCVEKDKEMYFQVSRKHCSTRSSPNTALSTNAAQQQIRADQLPGICIKLLPGQLLHGQLLRDKQPETPFFFKLKCAEN
jgi:hypothetical protein